MIGRERCPFTSGKCDGGEIGGGVIGCAFKEKPDDECEWIAELPDGTVPRDFYNAAIMEAIRNV